MRRHELAFSITLPLLPQPERSDPAVLVLQATPEAHTRRIICMDALLLKVEGCYNIRRLAGAKGSLSRAVSMGYCTAAHVSDLRQVDFLVFNIDSAIYDGMQVPTGSWYVFRD